MLFLNLACGGALLALCSAAAWTQPPSASAEGSAPATQVTPSSQNGDVAQSKQPSVHVASRVVQVSVVVKDKDGNPVSDLTSADFTILDDKKPQKIRFFRVETNEPPKEAPKPLPPDTYTNRLPDTASVPMNISVILFDGLNTKLTDQAQARNQVLRFLRQIRSEDQVALYTLGRDLRVMQDFTSDSSRLVAALGKDSGGTSMDLDASTPDQVQTGNDTIDLLLQNAFQREANFYIQERVHMTVEALTQIADHVAKLPGRKNLIWVSGSFPFSVGYDNIEDLQTRLNDPAAEQLLFAEDVEKAARALNDANVAVYPVDARGLVGFDMQTSASTAATSSPGKGAFGANAPNPQPGMLSEQGGSPRSGAPGGRRAPSASTTGKTAPPSPIKSPDKTNLETMQTLADRTGGRAFYNTNDIFGAVRRAVDDSRLTYELGYYPEDVKWDGAFHKIEIKVERPHVEVRARKGYFALPEPKLSPEARETALRLAAISPIAATEIALMAKLKATDAEGKRGLRVTVNFDAKDVSLTLKDGKYAGTVESVMIQYDGSQKALDVADETFHLAVEAVQYDKVRQTGITYSKNLTYQTSATHLRIVFRDASTGKVGSVDIPLVNSFPKAKSEN
jgi:VWFA-related protein